MIFPNQIEATNNDWMGWKMSKNRDTKEIFKKKSTYIYITHIDCSETEWEKLEWEEKWKKMNEELNIVENIHINKQ